MIRLGPITIVCRSKKLKELHYGPMRKKKDGNRVKKTKKLVLEVIIPIMSYLFVIVNALLDLLAGH
jgi:hypothetical protein